MSSSFPQPHVHTLDPPLIAPRPLPLSTVPRSMLAHTELPNNLGTASSNIDWSLWYLQQLTLLNRTSLSITNDSHTTSNLVSSTLNSPTLPSSPADGALFDGVPVARLQSESMVPPSPVASAELARSPTSLPAAMPRPVPASQRATQLDVLPGTPDLSSWPSDASASTPDLTQFAYQNQYQYQVPNTVPASTSPLPGLSAWSAAIAAAAHAYDAVPSPFPRSESQSADGFNAASGSFYPAAAGLPPRPSSRPGSSSGSGSGAHLISDLAAIQRHFAALRANPPPTRPTSAPTVSPSPPLRPSRSPPPSIDSSHLAKLHRAAQSAAAAYLDALAVSRGLPAARATAQQYAQRASLASWPPTPPHMSVLKGDGSSQQCQVENNLETTDETVVQSGWSDPTAMYISNTPLGTNGASSASASGKSYSASLDLNLDLSKDLIVSVTPGPTSVGGPREAGTTLQQLNQLHISPDIPTRHVVLDPVTDAKWARSCILGPLECDPVDTASVMSRATPDPPTETEADARRVNYERNVGSDAASNAQSDDASDADSDASWAPVHKVTSSIGRHRRGSSSSPVIVASAATSESASASGSGHVNKRSRRPKQNVKHREVTFSGSSSRPPAAASQSGHIGFSGGRSLQELWYRRDTFVEALHGAQRPISMKTDVIKKRQRTEAGVIVPIAQQPRTSIEVTRRSHDDSEEEDGPKTNRGKKRRRTMVAKKTSNRSSSSSSLTSTYEHAVTTERESKIDEDADCTHPPSSSSAHDAEEVVRRVSASENLVQEPQNSRTGTLSPVLICRTASYESPLFHSVTGMVARDNDASLLVSESIVQIEADVLDPMIGGDYGEMVDGFALEEYGGLGDFGR
ncbi:hypothetical protein HDU93_010020 [Gonapodya sp. JEL0774]|nr:hypothetical protein HDU93_010020 [Gonapodya sp. JEL0774]